VYDTTVLGPSGARDSSAITLREPGAEKAGPGESRSREPGTGEPGTGAADRAVSGAGQR
jgi:hypothetical protein